MIGAMLIFFNSNPKTVVYALGFAVLIGGILQVLAHILAIRKFNFPLGLT